MRAEQEEHVMPVTARSTAADRGPGGCPGTAVPVPRSVVTLTTCSGPDDGVAGLVHGGPDGGVGEPVPGDGERAGQRHVAGDGFTDAAVRAAVDEAGYA